MSYILKNIAFEDVIYNSSATNTTTLQSGTLVGVNNGKIENCSLTNAVCSFVVSKTITKGEFGYCMGGVVGVNNGEINGVTVENAITGNFTAHNNDNGRYSSSAVYTYYLLGGVVGKNNGKINSLTVISHISSWSKTIGGKGYYNACYAGGFSQIGGFAGANYGIIEDCGLNYKIDATDSGNNEYGKAKYYIGGFTRLNGAGGQINRCYAKGVINENGQKTNEIYIGGFVQNNSEMIKDCYAKCEINSVSAGSVVGGFASISSKTISSSYSVAKITVGNATTVGGFIAENNTNNTVNASVVKAEIRYVSATNIGLFAGITQSGSWYEKSYFSADSKLIRSEEEVTHEETNAGISVIENENLFSTNLLVKQLCWDTTIWVVDGINYPKFIYEPEEEVSTPGEFESEEEEFFETTESEELTQE